MTLTAVSLSLSLSLFYQLRSDVAVLFLRPVIGFSKYERHPDNAVCDVYLHETLQKKPIEACPKANERSRKLPQFFHVAQIKLLPRSDVFWLFDDRSVRKVIFTHCRSSSYINELEPLVYRKCSQSITFALFFYRAPHRAAQFV